MRLRSTWSQPAARRGSGARLTCVLLYAILGGVLACGNGAPSEKGGQGTAKVNVAVTEAAPESSTGDDGAWSLRAKPPPGTVQELTVEILRSFPHDPASYTQGLEWHDGSLLESTGRYGESRLRRLDPESGEIQRETVVDADLFAEGLTRVGERLIQITWQAGLALVYDAQTFAPREPFRYRGEGWGLCFDGDRLVMSDGSDVLAFRDPETFDLLGTVSVTLHGRPFGYLNELECVEGEVYANVYGSEMLVAIDPPSGEVRRLIDATGLLSASEKPGTEVLNGIAWRPDSEIFFVTGKLWPKIFEVRFVEK